VAIKVKPIADVSAKWAEVTPGRSAYYEKGATVAGADWEAKAVAAATAYKAGVSAANIEKMFAGGVKKAGAEKYNRKVKDVGVGRFGPGVTAAKGDYEKGEAPMLDTIAKVDLAARQPRGSTANFQRSVAVGVALNKQRLALRAAG
jgi:hypothetical protein